MHEVKVICCEKHSKKVTETKRKSESSKVVVQGTANWTTLSVLLVL